MEKRLIEPWREPGGQPYLFGSKERRRFASLGDSDFHARFLTTATALWQAPDVHAGKYPWLSPWVFCAANPIRYRDPSGKRIELDEKLSLKEIFTILLNLQKLTDDQLVYKTEIDGSKHVKIAYLGNGSHTYGTRLIRKLNSHKKTVTIDYKNSTGSIHPLKGNDFTKGNYCKPINKFDAENGAGSDSRIIFDPDAESKYGQRPAYIGLAHELIHASHNADGTAYYTDIDGDGAPYEEERNIGLKYNEGDEPTENNIRKEHGLPVRPQY